MTRGPRIHDDASGGKQLPERAVEQFTAGKVTMDQLALRMNVSRGKVAALLRAAGVDVPVRTRSRAEALPEGEIARYREGRTSVAAITRRTGIAEATVSRLLKAAGVEVRRKPLGHDNSWALKDDFEPKLPPDARSRYADGKVTLEELAAEMGCTVSEARRALNRAALHGGPRSPAKYTELPEDARKIYLAGATQAEVAERIGCHPETARRLLAEAGILRTAAENASPDIADARWRNRLRNHLLKTAEPAEAPPGLTAGTDVAFEPDHLVEPD